MQPQPHAKTFDPYLEAWEKRDIMRVLACGNTEDGKSALIARLLRDSKIVSSNRSSKSQTHENSPVITRHTLTTDKRTFLLAEAPDSELHTCYMVAEASRAELAIVLVDACKDVDSLLCYHSTILSLTSVQHVILAVNKMDLADWSRPAYDKIVEAYHRFTQQLGLINVSCIPLSARTGDNVTAPSPAMGWYQGPTLIQVLESANHATDPTAKPFRMPIQRVTRTQDGVAVFAGTIVSGLVHTGDSVLIGLSQEPSTVHRITAPGGDLARAVAGQAITLTLSDTGDANRGDVIASTSHPPRHSDQFACHLIWLHENELLPERPYLLKIGLREVGVQITELKYRLKADSQEHLAAKTLGLNDIGYCNISLDQRISFDPYREIAEMGSFILVDRYTQETVGAGTIDFSLWRAFNLTRHILAIDKPLRAAQKNQKACVVWFTGLSGSGKSTTANAVEQQLHILGRHSYLLDGDNLRHGLTKDLGFKKVDRTENVRRIAEAAKLFVDAGLIVLVSVISPFRDERRMAREMMEEGEFIEVFVDAPLDVCEQRDPKGLYKKARAGEIKNFTGIDSAYEPPENPEIVLKTAEHQVYDLADNVVAYLQSSFGPTGN